MKIIEEIKKINLEEVAKNIKDVAVTKRTFFMGAAGALFFPNVKIASANLKNDRKDTSYSDLMNLLRNGSIQEMDISSSRVVAIDNEGNHHKTILSGSMPLNEQLPPALLLKSGANITFSSANPVKIYSRRFQNNHDFAADHIAGAFIGATASIGIELLEDYFTKNRKFLISNVSLRSTAQHEAGHAVNILVEDGLHLFRSASVKPGKGFLGVVYSVSRPLPRSATKKMLFSEMVISMGGKAAEIACGDRDDYTIGISNDIMKAKKMAKEMVMRYGMGTRTGPTPIITKEDGLLARMFKRFNISPEMNRDIELDIQDLMSEAEAKALLNIETHRKEFDIIWKALIEEKELSPERIKELTSLKQALHPDETTPAFTKDD